MYILLVKVTNDPRIVCRFIVLATLAIKSQAFTVFRASCLTI